ncbi:MAG TPA: outer membrane lipoprotein carrier protein LolA [Candidatus Acidoferrales bacterium]|jgi:outer membrane lipoprotein carrier protein|nr:outer membrane lipoprotein carrier protein LolA [Candidatus Acidoferrales bacterium]
MLAAILAILLAGSSISERDGNAVRDALEARYQHARTLRASFFERYTDGNGGASSESGTVYFSRPGRMRWEYESPEQKLFIVDGTNVWFYVPADHTASRAKMKESSDWRTPLALLTGKADLSKLCRSIQLVGADAEKGSQLAEQAVPPANSVLLCLPRGASGTDPSFQVLFETDPDSQLVRVLIREPSHVETEFRFGNWEENVAIPEVKFHFQPPPGVAIVDEESLANQIR